MRKFSELLSNVKKHKVGYPSHIFYYLPPDPSNYGKKYPTNVMSEGEKNHSSETQNKTNERVTKSKPLLPHHD